MNDKQLESLSEIFGYEFRDPTLLKRALTHGSVNEPNNEVLEFLGDAVLNFVVSTYLYDQKSETTEGVLTQKRSQIVNNHTALRQVAQHLNLAEYLRVGKSFHRTNERAWLKIQSNSVEAVIGAIYLDGGLEEATKFFHSRFLPALDQTRSQELKDHKSKLQEFLQAQSESLPVYKIIQRKGKDHQPLFTVSCNVSGLKSPVTAKGRSIKEAEQSAASKVNELLGG